MNMNYETSTEEMGQYRVLPDTSIAFDNVTDSAYGSIVNGVLGPFTEEDIDLLEQRCIIYNSSIWNSEWVEQHKKNLQNERKVIEAQEADLDHLLRLIGKK